MQANITRMQQRMDTLGVALRPHVKTHKCLEIAERQVRAGADGLTVATVAEAEVFAAAGFDDLFIAYPLWVDRDKGARIHRLQGEPIGNYRRTVGIVGASRIGRRVIELLRHFDYRILLYDPLVGPEGAAALGAEKADLDPLMARSDIVSLHAPSLPETRHMIDARRLSLMKEGATLINTARGALVDEAALIDRLKTGAIHAVIDVTDPEVPEASSPLYDLPNVFLTPHIAGAIGLERTRLGEMAVDEIARFVAGRPLDFEIRKADLERIA